MVLQTSANQRFIHTKNIESNNMKDWNLQVVKGKMIEIQLVCLSYCGKIESKLEQGCGVLVYVNSIDK